MFNITLNDKKEIALQAKGSFDELMADMIYCTAIFYKEIASKQLTLEDFLNLYVGSLTHALGNNKQEGHDEVQTYTCHRPVGKLS